MISEESGKIFCQFVFALTEGLPGFFLFVNDQCKEQEVQISNDVFFRYTSKLEGYFKIYIFFSGVLKRFIFS